MNIDMPADRRRLQRQVALGPRIFAAEVHLMPRYKSARIYTRDITDRREAEEKSRANIEKLSRMMEGIVNALASASELRDPYTAGHQKRVSQLACALAREIGMAGDTFEGVRVAATLHDIGKMYVPAEILTKPGRLAPVEFSIIKVHPEAGSGILKPIDFPWPVAQIVHQHHERMDGTGYPNGISGDAIMKEARIIAVADVVEAMASHRPYRPALGIERAISEIKNAKAGIYDPEVVAACLILFNAKGFEFK
ncbi:MAG: HD-GYP domain-containing protein [Planctomycetes bacterium]|nr:HD-GYP domain-containing protein [Planctomycetota bacterium]